VRAFECENSGENRCGAIDHGRGRRFFYRIASVIQMRLPVRVRALSVRTGVE
jgi:hypothetical protein